jgi:hypothetical protein
MTYDENSPERAMKEIVAASNSMRQTLLQVKEQHPNLPKLDIRVTESTEGTPSPPPGPGGVAARLIITVEADTQEHAEQHGAELENQGCHCTSTGESTVECDCSDVP